MSGDLYEESDLQILKILIAILSSHRHAERRGAVRDTWLKELSGADYRFFVGGMDSADDFALPPDVVNLNCNDSYSGLAEKTRAVAFWAHDRGYDFLFKCDDDTYVRTDRLLLPEFKKHDYSGFIEDRDCRRRAYPFPVFPHAQGGSGYWLSRKAMGIVAQWITQREQEDFMVGEALDKAGIPAFHDGRYCHEDIPQVRDRILGGDFITLHKCLPAEMRRVHAQLKSFCPVGAE